MKDCPAIRNRCLSLFLFVSFCMSTGFSEESQIVFGSVMENEVEFTTGVAAYLNTIGNAEKFGEELLSLYKTTMPSNVIICISGQGINIETRTDAKGRFQFRELNPGKYEITAEKNRTLPGGTKERISARKTINTITDSNVTLILDEKYLSVRGRVVDKNGKGIPNIKLIGYLENQYDAPGELTKFTAVSDKDGSYVLEEIPLPSVWIIGGWLNGGNPAVSQSPFFLEIRTGDGMGTSMIRHLPLVTANLLEQARRLHAVMNSAYTRLNLKGKPLKDASGQHIPESNGNVIIAPDITLITEVGSRK